MCFELVSDLKINLQKNEVIPIGETVDVNRATFLFGCRVGKLPTSYLGLPLGALNKHCGVWDSIEERFKRKLVVWKKHYLSKGGRLVLLKSTLSNLLIYFMSLFVIPRKVRIRLERIQRDFLWGALGERSKIHLVKWSNVCKAKNFGGLGIRRLHSLNQALLGKWLRRFFVECESLWKKIICGKFEGWRGVGLLECGRSPLGWPFGRTLEKGGKSLMLELLFV